MYSADRKMDDVDLWKEAALQSLSIHSEELLRSCIGNVDMLDALLYKDNRILSRNCYLPTIVAYFVTDWFKLSIKSIVLAL